jgi:hypothetical protein
MPAAASSSTSSSGGSGVTRFARVALVLALVLAGCGAVPPAVSPSSPPEPTAVPGGSASASASAVASPSPALPTVPAPDAITVTLGIYSGRPDPTWTLRGTDAALVAATLATLQEAPGAAPEGGLGYHGFALEINGNRLVAYRGMVATGGATVLLDPGRGLERLLLELGRGGLTATEIAAVEGDLAAAP